MREEKGLVSSVESGGWAYVMVKNEPGCAHCSAAGGCGAALNSDKKAVKALNRAGAKKGDPVSVVYGSGSLKTAALVYIFPLALMIVGAALGSVLGVQFHLARETASVIFGFGGLAVGFGILVIVSRMTSRSKASIPVINRILTHNPAGAHDIGCR